MKKYFYIAILLFSSISLKAQIIEEKQIIPKIEEQQQLEQKEVKKSPFIQVKLKKTLPEQASESLIIASLQKLHRSTKSLEAWLETIKKEATDQPAIAINELIKMEIEIGDLLIPKIKEIALALTNINIRRYVLSAIYNLEEFISELKDLPPIAQDVEVVYNQGLYNFLDSVAKYIRLQSRAIEKIIKRLKVQAAEKSPVLKQKKETETIKI